MIGPSDLLRIPRADPVRRSEDLARFARLEYRATGLEWALPADHVRADRTQGLWQWLTSHLRIPAATMGQARSETLQPNLAAVHFGTEVSPGTSRVSMELEHDHTCGGLATASLILTVHPSQPQADDPCSCDH